ncbi:hypothetical protein OUZ56_005786 [Daphnia magna]|uniref:Uncharacterized protein n=1 Tax=Daphnia magna TaxID=35525 RepID=A0ABQ9YTU1_9CRUS|nr:hypothetical protein OUZ56_005786 [Daphnia magna]
MMKVDFLHWYSTTIFISLGVVPIRSPTVGKNRQNIGCLGANWKNLKLEDATVVYHLKFCETNGRHPSTKPWAMDDMKL